MLEVHAPHEAPHTWQGIFIHIAIIVVGLIIAVALEQTVEFFHHRRVSQELERQMLEVFAADLRSDTRNLGELRGLRAYLVEVRSAIIARLGDKAAPSMPAATDPRMATFPVFPSMAPYDAAKANGSIAFLPTMRIRLYNRAAFARELAATVRDHWFEGLAALGAFHERYADSTGSLEMAEVSAAPDIARLTPPELNEYLALVAALIKKTDLYVARLQLFDRECQAILDGVRDEEELIRRVTPRLVGEQNAAALPR